MDKTNVELNSILDALWSWCK